jgi:spermidine/putrescine-binding protein
MTINRRNFLEHAALGTLAAFTVPPLFSRGAYAAYAAKQIDDALAKMQGRSLVVVSWGGAQQEAMRKAWFQPFGQK